MYLVNEGVVLNYNRVEKGYKNRNLIVDLKGRIRLKIKLLLVEDYYIVWRGFVFFLKMREEFEIIGEVENGEEVLYFM